MPQENERGFTLPLVILNLFSKNSVSRTVTHIAHLFRQIHTAPDAAIDLDAESTVSFSPYFSWCVSLFLSLQLLL